MPKPEPTSSGIGPNSLNPRSPNSSDVDREIQPDKPHPIDPPEVPPKQEVERPVDKPASGNADRSPAGKVPAQPADNKMMPSDNPNKGVNSYMDE